MLVVVAIIMVKVVVIVVNGTEMVVVSYSTFSEVVAIGMEEINPLKISFKNPLLTS